MTTYRDRDAPGPAGNDDEKLPPPQPCRWCQKVTPQVTLALYGRCWPCFAAYCSRETAPLGFVDGRRDTVTQAQMRARVRSA